jgi:hypothetical protein
MDHEAYMNILQYALALTLKDLCKERSTDRQFLWQCLKHNYVSMYCVNVQSEGEITWNRAILLQLAVFQQVHKLLTCMVLEISLPFLQKHDLFLFKHSVQSKVPCYI